MAGRSGSVPPPPVLSSMLQRSEGNPLYVEELVAAEQFSGTSRMPEHLADLLLARVDRLGDDTRRLLRVASTDGTSLDTEVLIQVTELQARGRRGKPSGGGRRECTAPTSRPPRVPARLDPGGRVRRPPPRRADADARVGGPGPVGADRGGQGSLVARPEPRCLPLARGARHTARPGRVDTGGQRRDTTRCSRGRPSPRVRRFQSGTRSPTPRHSPATLEQSFC